VLWVPDAFFGADIWILIAVINLTNFKSNYSLIFKTYEERNIIP